MNYIGEIINGELDSFDIRECYENNIIKKFKIEDVFILDMRFMWINSKINFITKRINQLDKKLIENQLNFNILDKSMRLLEQPFEDIFKNVRNNKTFTNTNLPEFGFTVLESNEMDVTEKIEGVISKVIGQPLIIWENIYIILNKFITILLIVIIVYRPDFVNV